MIYFSITYYKLFCYKLLAFVGTILLWLFIISFYKIITRMNKKPILNVKQRKDQISLNPYNDLPSMAQTKSLKIMNGIYKISSDMAENTQNSGSKLQKKGDVHDARMNQGIRDQSKNSKDFLNKLAADANTKATKINNRLGKYNDYFDNGNKPAKRLIDISKNSAESNSSIKSIKSQDNNYILNSKGLAKNKRANLDGIGTVKSKPFPICLKNQKSNKLQNKPQNQFTDLLKPPPSENKLNDNRKSWSHYNGLGVHKNNQQEIISKAPKFGSDSSTQSQKHIGNPQTAKKISSIKNKIIGEGSQKSTIKKQGFAYALNPSKQLTIKKTGDGNQMNKKNGLETREKELEQKKSSLTNSATMKKEQNIVEHSTIFKPNQIVKLKVLSPDPNIQQFAFRVLKVIQNDENTSLYMVCQILTDTLYCLKKCKVFRAQQTAETHLLNKLDYLIKQGKIGGLIDHPYLVKTYCTLYDDGTNIYQLMEFIEGQNLYVRNKKYFCQSNKNSERDCLGLQKNSLSKMISKMNTIRQIISQMLEGLCYLHEKGFVHRDIKPSNILIAQGNTYKISDFGTAIWKQSIEPIGTLDYAAPEIMMKQPCDSSNDMWAVGCIAFQLYVGYPPFYNDNRQITIRKIVDCEYEHFKIQDEGLAYFISRLLQRKKQKRMTAGQALNHPFIKQLASILD